MTEKIKAVGLLSGGLDSTLAVKLMIDQGIEVHALKFTSPFCNCNSGGKCHAKVVAEKFNIPLKTMVKGDEYLSIIRNPKYGHGSGMNACVDCRIYCLKKAQVYADEIGAKFIFTGEVFGQRPMSQRRRALEIIERDSGLVNKLVRPLSAKFFKKTEAEEKGWIDREKMLSIKGRSRKPQIELAKRLGIADYPCPGGGCLLTYKEFANKVRDLFTHKRKVTMKDIVPLKIGRHFRYGTNKIIVGSNETENKQLMILKDKGDYVFDVPGCGSPITVLQGKKTKDAITMAARITARYSDSTAEKVVVKYGKDTPLDKEIIVEKASQEEINGYRI